ncbi:MAG TPA: CDP-alcohol phosphatidyltransferase family protein [Croceibacterium sp.]
MDIGSHPSAVAAFSGARAANQRLAGVSAAGRIVREVAEAGFAQAWLDLPVGEVLDAAAMADVQRLAGAMPVRFGRPPAGERALELSGDHLIPAAALRQPDRLGATDSIDLSRSDAAGRILQGTGKASDGPISRWLNRPVSRWFSGLLLRIPGLRPIHATVGTALLSALMVVALFAGGSWGLVLGGVLFQAASVFDGVDGEVARATFRTSRGGAALDTALDTATNMLFVLGVAVNLALDGRGDALALAAWGLSAFALGVAVLGWHAIRTGGPFSFNRIKQHYKRRAPGPLLGGLIAFLTVVSSRDFFVLLFSLLAIAGLAMGVLYLFALCASIWVLFVAGSVLPRRREAAGNAA